VPEPTPFVYEPPKSTSELYRSITEFFNNSGAIEAKLSISDPREAIKLIQSLSDSEKFALMSASQFSSNGSNLVKLEGYGRVTVEVPDKPIRTVFRESDIAHIATENLSNTVARALTELHQIKPFSEDRTAISDSEIALLDKKNNARLALERQQSDPKYIMLGEKIGDMKLQYSETQKRITEIAQETIAFNRLYEKDPGFTPRNDSSLLKTLSDNMQRLDQQIKQADSERSAMIKPAIDANRRADAEYNKLLHGNVTQEKINQTQLEVAKTQKEFAMKRDENLIKLEKIKLAEDSIKLEAEANRLRETITVDTITKPLYTPEQLKSLEALAKERTVLMKETEVRETAFNKKSSEYDKLVKKFNQFTEDKVSQQVSAYKQAERLAVATEILKNPILKTEISEDLTKSVNRLNDAKEAYKEALIKSVDANSNDPLNAKELKADAEKLGKELKKLTAEFDKKYSTTLDDVIRLMGTENNSSSLTGESMVISDSFKKLFKKDTGLIETLSATTKSRELTVYVDEATGNFRLGELKYTTPTDFVEGANTLFKQTSDLKYLLSLETAETIKYENLSDSEASYLRSKWCVAISTWGMLKRDFGDAIPEFTQFTKEMVSLGYINPSNMELSSTNGGTANIVNHYANSSGRSFERVSLESSGNRTDRYEALANDLIEKKPAAITLRVKDIDGKGHTISLQRNPDNRTYTVVDTAQPTINGTIFDPENISDSPLGNNDQRLNPYAKLLPKGYDYVN
jgi:hypothetical protein